MHIYISHNNNSGKNINNIIALKEIKMCAQLRTNKYLFIYLFIYLFVCSWAIDILNIYLYICLFVVGHTF